MKLSAVVLLALCLDYCLLLPRLAGFGMFGSKISPIASIRDKYSILNQDTKSRDAEPSNSLMVPIDMSSDSWKMLGNAVLTSSFARLTPKESGQQGVLWNSHALEVNDFQIVLEVSIHDGTKNKDALGGDGLGLWFLHKSDYYRMKNSKSSNVTRAEMRRIDSNPLESPLVGNIFGMRNDFNGFGLILDTYDNENSRDNPLVFVLKQNIVDGTDTTRANKKNSNRVQRNNINAEVTNWDIDQDFEKTMERGSFLQNKCTLKYHNKERVRLVIRYQKGVLHVYSDMKYHHEQGGATGKWQNFGINMPLYNMMNKLDPSDSTNEGPKLCLSVPIRLNLKNTHHIALSAMTGGVSDNHDVVSLETKYLEATDHDVDDAKLVLQKYSSDRGGWISFLYWFFIVGISVSLVAETLSELSMLSKVMNSKVHMVYAVSQINKSIQVSYLIHFVQLLLLILSFHVKVLLVNLPLGLIRMQKYVSDDVLVEPHKINKRWFWCRTTFQEWLYCRLVFLLVAAAYHVWRLLHV